jgi:hypothetical protein
LYLSIRRAVKQIVINIEAYHFFFANYVRQILEKKVGIQQSSASGLIDFKNSYVSVRRELLYV